MKEVIRYQCEFCEKKYYKNKSSAASHEKKCYYNPKNKACATCVNAEWSTNTVYVPPQGDQNYGDADYEETILYCNRYNERLDNGDMKLKSMCRLYREGLNIFKQKVLLMDDSHEEMLKEFRRSENV